MPSLGQPSNDNCGSAIAVGDGTFTANNTMATTDGSASCGFLSDPGGGDLWWRYTPSVTGMATMDTCGSDFDTILSVYVACAGAERACNDDQLKGGCGSPLPVTRSRVDLAVNAGTPYLVRVAGYRTRRGNITLHIMTTGTAPFCGDGTCNGDEDPCSCPADGCIAICGDLCCSDDENPELCPGDCATLADFAAFQNCFTGDSVMATHHCESLDSDEDDDIDLDDFSEFLARRWAQP